MIACRLVTFKDHFSSRAADYAVFRPRYPDALFEFLVSESPARDLAWDCATGNGQAAVGLAATPSFAIDRLLTLDELAGYLRTWSATRRYMERHGVDPVDDVIAEVAPIWGDPSAQRAARWPLSVRVGRV